MTLRSESYAIAAPFRMGGRVVVTPVLLQLGPPSHSHASEAAPSRPAKTTTTWRAESKTKPGDLRAEGLVVNVRRVHAAPSHSQVSASDPEDAVAPPKSTTRLRVASYAIRALLRAGGPTALICRHALVAGAASTPESRPESPPAASRGEPASGARPPASSAAPESPPSGVTSEQLDRTIAVVRTAARMVGLRIDLGCYQRGCALRSRSARTML